MSLRTRGVLRTVAANSTKHVVESIVNTLQKNTRAQSAHQTRPEKNLKDNKQEKQTSSDTDISLLLATILSRDFNRKTYGELQEIRSKMMEILLRPEHSRSARRTDEVSSQDGASQSRSQERQHDPSRLHALNNGIMLVDWVRKPGNFVPLTNLVKRRISDLLADVDALEVTVVNDTRPIAEDGLSVRS